ncbi:uncharacterized protein SPPG_06036 [Spizellomyces punctatus DAOM BR117]|uniref:Uncharacterized protein n=1 Tax=Spizellomyces punctatus (strain DAOM BR117) TaxID=645134 RepID=A0A0L0HDL8_SPIPD|nr:uncharacterized protein SPPG_06036 [Spizellomyces punctatus DAOM BR117]KNC99091.1 hypothetical protein SPPG_06036 [Spizellomyces punctatus DAOM BR117]|eukprot:XP_016607131.1 hypothetical protein SPPG_06036 [Spizellomyces punctatus DAOM BR117]
MAETPKEEDSDKIHISDQESPAPLKKGRKLPKNWGHTHTCPQSTASLWSRLSYTWLNPVFYVGWQRPLDHNDIWELGPTYKVEHVHRLLDDAWKEELVKVGWSHQEQSMDGSSRGDLITSQQPSTSIQPSLWRAMRRAWFWRLAPIGIAKCLGDFALIFSPFMVKYILKFVAASKSIADENREHGTEAKLPPLAEGFGYVIGLFVLQMIGSLLNNYYFQVAGSEGMSVRAALTAAIYRKTLRLSSAARQDFNPGKVMTIVSTDTQRIDFFLQFLHVMWTAPLQILTISILLITQLGPSALAGIGLLLLVAPLQTRIMRKLAVIRKTIAPITDTRVKLTQEILTGIRLIKYFAWEESFLSKISSVREKEINQLLHRATLSSLVLAIAFGIPILSASLSIIIYALTHPLDASEIFPALTWFGQLRFPLMFLPQGMVALVDFRVALGRIKGLLLADELDVFPGVVEDEEIAVRVVDGCFVWEGGDDATKGAKSAVKDGGHDAKKQGDDDATKYDKTTLDDGGHKTTKKEGDDEDNAAKQQANDRKISNEQGTTTGDIHLNTIQPRHPLPGTLQNINLTLPKGALIAIIGPVGSGKSSLLNALISEMRRTSGTIQYSGKLGYCPQQPWILNTTLRNNITFSRPFDQTKYIHALHACALEPDLSLLPNADMTQIGERGITLSGGQKQRLNLARCIYLDSDIILLDDPLSAVDAHVGAHLFEKCILGALKGKTRVLVTHQLRVLPRCDMVVVMNEGRVVEVGGFEELMKKEGEMARLMKAFGGLDDKVVGDEGKVEDDAGHDGSRDQRVNTLVQADENATLGDNLSPAEQKEKPTVEDFTTLDETATPDTSEEATLARIKAIITRTHVPHTLMTTEDRATGSVDTRVWLSYVKAAGGLSFTLPLLVLLVIIQSARVGTDFWLVIWTNDRIPSFTTKTYVGIYWAWGIFQTLSLYLFGLFFALFGTRASRTLHAAALSRILQSPVSFFDSTPLGRIINRFSKDTDTIDTTLSDSFRTFINTFAVAVSTFVLIVYATPFFIIPLVPILGIYYLLQKIYRATSRELKRLDSTTRSPLYAHFGETLHGAPSIRAYGEQARFISQTDTMINTNNAPTFLLVAAQRWLGVRLESLGAVLVFFAGLFGLLNRDNDALSPALLGLSLSYALQVTQTLNWGVRQFTETEIAMNAVERIEFYAYQIEVEPVPPPPPPPTDFFDGPAGGSANVIDGVTHGVTSKATPDGTPSITIVSHTPPTPPPPTWPTTGTLTLTNLTLRYPNQPPVLHIPSLHIPHASKIGIVGRTGSGKSTLVSSLFRIIEPCTGTITLDSIPIHTLPLASLRRGLTIIPQDPTLFSSTLRTNLDPFSLYTDTQLHDALSLASLTPFFSARQGLDTRIDTSGENLSVGQRQLVCLARALLRHPKILIMDEATANVDLETDALIQKLLRRAFRDCTILCIAHRVGTVLDYDRVLVLDKGRVVEFDEPGVLVKRGGVFAGMVSASA